MLNIFSSVATFLDTTGTLTPFLKRGIEPPKFYIIEGCGINFFEMGVKQEMRGTDLSWRD